MHHYKLKMEESLTFKINLKIVKEALISTYKHCRYDIQLYLNNKLIIDDNVTNIILNNLIKDIDEDVEEIVILVKGCGSHKCCPGLVWDLRHDGEFLIISNIAWKERFSKPKNIKGTFKILLEDYKKEIIRIKKEIPQSSNKENINRKYNKWEMREFKVNEYIKVSFGVWFDYIDTIILVGGDPLAVDICLAHDQLVPDNIKINSIDDLVPFFHDQMYDYDIRLSEPCSLLKTKQNEFWGICSNLQVFVENNYNTDFLTAHIAFPLLKKLMKLNDPLAKQVFLPELKKRFEAANIHVLEFFIDANYLKYLEIEDIKRVFGEIFTQDEYSFVELLEVFEHAEKYYNNYHKLEKYKQIIIQECLKKNPYPKSYKLKEILTREKNKKDKEID